MKNSVLNSPRLSELKKKRRKVFLNKIIISVLGTLLILVFLSFLSRIDRVNINQIVISGNKVLDTELLKKSVEEEIRGHYLWIFPKTNIFFYPKDQIRNSLQESYKRIKDINLSVKDNKILELSLTEREPKYTWCGNEPVSSVGDQKCYFIDKDGYIFDEAPYFSGDVYYKFYGKVSEENPIGHHFFKENFNNLVVFENTLELIKLKPVSTYVEENGDVRIFLSSLKTSNTKPEIIFKIDADIENIAENLQTALTTEPLQTDFKKKYSSLLYIDLRYGNKVFYKFQ